MWYYLQVHRSFFCFCFCPFSSLFLCFFVILLSVYGVCDPVWYFLLFLLVLKSGFVFILSFCFSSSSFLHSFLCFIVFLLFFFTSFSSSQMPLPPPPHPPASLTDSIFSFFFFSLSLWDHTHIFYSPFPSTFLKIFFSYPPLPPYYHHHPFPPQSDLLKILLLLFFLNSPLEPFYYFYIFIFITPSSPPPSPTPSAIALSFLSWHTFLQEGAGLSCIYIFLYDQNYWRYV